MPWEIVFLVAAVAVFALWLRKNQAQAPGDLSAPPPAAPPASSADFDPLILAGQKIQAIKALRKQTGMGLKEAKDWVDQRARDLGKR